MGDKLSNSIEAKEIVLYYYEMLESQVDKSIARYINMAKHLLKTYSKEEVLYTIDHCVKHQPSGGMYSFGFIGTMIEEISAQYRSDVAKEIIKKAEANSKEIGELPKASDNSKKLKNFGIKKEFDWDA
jgi:3-hydroxy-3-methylglutaryl CoA synthase